VSHILLSILQLIKINKDEIVLTLYDSFFTQNEEELFLVETNEKTSSNTIKWVLKEDIKTKMVDDFMNISVSGSYPNPDCGDFI
jgi:hypothetical protein